MLSFNSNERLHGKRNGFFPQSHGIQGKGRLTEDGHDVTIARRGLISKDHRISGGLCFLFKVNDGDMAPTLIKQVAVGTKVKFFMLDAGYDQITLFFLISNSIT